MKVRVFPSNPEGTVTVPSSKSMSHRAVICACLANGESTLFNVSHSNDIDASVTGMELLGAQLRKTQNQLLVKGSTAFPKEKITFDCNESGSTLRFLIPLCSVLCGKGKFTGRGRLLARPQSVYQDIFDKQGLFFRHLPEEIELSGRLSPGEYILRGDVSSQFVTGLLFALPLLNGDSTIRVIPPFESRSYVEMTLQVMDKFGVQASFAEENVLHIPGGQAYHGISFQIEGDYSQAAFFAVLGSIGGSITCCGLPAITKQGDRVITDILNAYGAGIEKRPDGLRFEKRRLVGTAVDLSDCPDLGPVLMTLGAFSEGETRIENAGRLRLKESDRIFAMEEELSHLGVAVRSTPDTVTIKGGSAKERKTEVTVDCHKDHRIAMSLAVFAACSAAPVVLNGAECVQKSYPLFFEDLKRAGVTLEILS